MAGSLTYRTYRADSGTFHSIRMDESNASAAGATGGQLCPERVGDYGALPRGLKPRYVNTFDANLPRRKRRFIVGDPALVADLIVPGAIIDSEVYPNGEDDGGGSTSWVVTSYRGERTNIIPGRGNTDTGLTDGTSSQ